jgi:hypothetical protein
MCVSHTASPRAHAQLKELRRKRKGDKKDDDAKEDKPKEEEEPETKEVLVEQRRATRRPHTHV